MDFITNILSYILPILGAIMLLVFVHEMGHFLFAKLFKMRVERFSIGFPPKIFSKKIGETEYVIAATPLGGYVKITGMVDESMDTDYAESEPKPWEFLSKPVWQRIVVITAGVIFNVILAAFVFIGLKAAYGEAYIPAEGDVFVVDSSLAWQMGLRTGDNIVAINGEEVDEFDGLKGLEEAIFADPLRITVERDGARQTFEGPSDIMTQLSRSGGTFGIGFDPALVGTVVEGSAASELGLITGDRILAINGEPVRFWREMTTKIQESEGQPMVLRWERPDSLAGLAPPSGVRRVMANDSAAVIPVGSARVAVNGIVLEGQITPRESDGRYVLGIFQLVRHEQYSLAAAIPAGIVDTWVNTKLIATSLKRVFSGQENLRENLGGPIMIAVVTKEAAEAGAGVFWKIVAMLSITLAIINILPIPALDGGHLVFLIYEGITRREPSLKVRMVMQQIGMVLLLAFMTFLIFNDILRL